MMAVNEVIHQKRGIIQKSGFPKSKISEHDKQDKYTMDPGQSSLSQQKENTFWSTKTNKKNA